ncbi:hypothetical protein [Microvirga pudoricolor]|uniref:hypothetical protein n=1 Tax=Microvirga pudoricolor TaxID=2778729 RepID=UPI001952605E|nr:hypothetical protein [Microvirga pudoricolor]MBM6593085.1 hypothetical protein [Microvirga pudoricolor]
MAKGSSGKAGGTSRIRFIMVEAEIADGDVGQITQAIQNALRGPAAPAQRITAPNGTRAIAHQEPPEIEGEVEVEDEAQAEEAPRAAKQRGPRKPAATPQVLDLDLTSDVSLATFAQKASPKSHAKRFLLIAAWFKEHRDVDTITVDHVYTCYRALKWPTGIADFAQPLRDLKGEQYFTTPERGHYMINHLGLAEVENLINGGDGWS